MRRKYVYSDDPYNDVQTEFLGGGGVYYRAVVWVRGKPCVSVRFATRRSAAMEASKMRVKLLPLLVDLLEERKLQRELIHAPF